MRATLVIIVATLTLAGCGASSSSSDVTLTCGDIINMVQKDAYDRTGHSATAEDLRIAYQSPECSP